MPDDCIACGTCCFSTLTNYVRVTGDDHARLGEDVSRHVRFDGNRAYMRMKDGHCSALTMTGDSFLCSVYDRRPQTCRDLKRNSLQCEGELFAKAQRPLVALRRQRASAFDTSK